MLNTALTLTGVSTTTVYSLVSIVDSKSVRKDSTAAVGTSKTLTISHGKRNPKDPNSADRRLVRLDWTKPNSVSGLPETLSFQLVLEVPTSGTWVDANVEDLKLQLTNFLLGNSGAEFNQFQAGEP